MTLESMVVFSVFIKYNGADVKRYLDLWIYCGRKDKKLTEIKKCMADEMTPVERKMAIEKGEAYDRIPCVPFMGELKGVLSGVSVWDLSHDPEKMAEAEIIPFNRYGYDRMDIGPNSRGITEALGGRVVYPRQGVPYMDVPLLDSYARLETMEPVNAHTNERIQDFAGAAAILEKTALAIVPVEMSIGGPLTIASNLRGVERLLRDCRKKPDDVLRLMRIITDSEKSCIDLAAEYGMGTAMADPVANPALIGPAMYEKFVYPFTKELTDYAYAKTGKKVSLHMCGMTDKIWKYFRKYQLNEVSLDNIVDLEKAALELGEAVPIAGNVDPVEIIMNGTRQEILKAVTDCIDAGLKSEKGYVLASGCDIPETTRPEQIDVFMEAARTYRCHL